MGHYQSIVKPKEIQQTVHVISTKKFLMNFNFPTGHKAPPTDDRKSYTLTGK